MGTMGVHVDAQYFTGAKGNTMRHLKSILVVLITLAISVSIGDAKTVREAPKSHAPTVELTKSREAEDAEAEAKEEAKKAAAEAAEEAAEEARNAAVEEETEEVEISGTPDEVLPEEVAAFNALTLPQRKAIYSMQTIYTMELLDGSIYGARIFHGSEDTIYSVTGRGTLDAVPAADIIPHRLFLIRLACMKDRDIYSDIEATRRVCIIDPDDEELQTLATAKLDAIAAQRPEFAEVVQGVKDNPNVTLVHPDVPLATQEYADRTFELVKEHVNRDAHLVETDHFLIYSTWADSNDRGLGRACEDLYDELLDQFDLEEDDVVWATKLPVYCFWETSEFEDFVDLSLPADQARARKSKKAAGYCGGGDGLVYVVLNRMQRDGDDATETRRWFYEVMTHETTHAFNLRYQSDVRLPGWLDEGLAEYMAGTLVKESRASTKWVDQTKIVADNNLDVSYNLNSFGGKPVDYGVSQSFVRYMLKTRTRRESMVTFYTLLKAGADQDRAMQVAFGMTLDEFYDEWRAAIK
jgi:hypothetical protein